ncbi:M64 family metallopeptidase [Dyadobacter sp. CY323]|uniref:M64 family metallopeptidase n=1 Tax=Dyadobacter sp. CY323 TaxID=2907302 RepID=UPI001F425FC4|nr:M64 family metallopeptidase [Dyadobacter sp. CY323]MCE6990006.1 M64 family metallo-endopeptidase [Dyadobacter sp. CY323]
MKKAFTTLFFLLIICKSFAQTFTVDTLYKTGVINNRINVVILGDGFTEEEMPKFRAEAKKFADFFLSYDPYNHYKGYFNFFSISTPSKESGVTNPGTSPDAYPDQPVGKKNTFYSGTFGSSIHRLVTVNYSVVMNVLSSNFPSYDLAVVLVNTKFYGGSGGSIAVHTLHDQAHLIGVHEIGHTFSALNDEYWAGPGYGWEAPNMTQNSNPSTIKWRNWLNSDNIGIYQHGFSGESETWHKPTSGGCLMEVLLRPFCAVCKEATTEKILFFVNPVEKVEPDAEGVTVVGKPQVFKLHLVNPDPNTLSVDWKLDGQLISKAPKEITLSPENLPEFGTLTATIFDSTAMSRRDNAREQRTWTMEWKLQSESPGVFKVEAAADSICAGFETVLTASGCRGTTSWSTGVLGTSLTVKPTTTTAYIASCNVEGRETTTSEISITVLPLPAATATNTGPYFEGAVIELKANGGVTYEWTGPLNFSAKTEQASIQNAKQANAGAYQVKVTDRYGCVAAAITDVRVDPILAVEKSENNFVRVSPNPAKEYIRIETHLPGESTIVFYNANGQQMLKKAFEGKTQVKLTAGTGLYLFRFKNGASESSGKLIIE